MSTNYYFNPQREACLTCERSFEPLHIGKLSGGWEFTFAGHEKLGILTFADWRVVLQTGGTIVDEYGRAVSLDDFVALVKASRKGDNRNHAKLLYPVNARLDPDGWAFIDGEFC